MAQRARWVVRKGEGTRLGDVLSRMLAASDPGAIKDGRVFVGKRRARSLDDAVTVGDEVFVASRTRDDAVPATILFDEDGLVAADKPADSVTIPDHGGSGSLIAAVARTLGVDVTTLHATSRLDRGVSGVVFFARTERAAERLRRAREEGRYRRCYVAIAAMAPPLPEGEWDAPIGRAPNPRHRAARGDDAAPSRSRYLVVARAGAWALLSLEPITGRTHQLRVHAADGGAPLVGDRVYGGPSRATLPTGSVLSFDRVALHAGRVSVPRADGSVVHVASPAPAKLREWWVAAGGDDAAWGLALSP
jgi:RluA family pseudouridine synthase